MPAINASDAKDQGGPLDVICSADVTAAKPPPGRTMSCAGYLAHIGDAFIESVEIAQRAIENFGPPSPCCSTLAAGFRNKRSYGVTVGYAF